MSIHFRFVCIFLHMCHAEQYRIHTKKVTVKKQQKNRHEMQKSYLPWQISYLCNLYDVKKRFLCVIKKINNYQIWILKKKYIKSTRNWVLRANLQRPFSTMQCLTREMVKHVTVMDTVVFTATHHTCTILYSKDAWPVMWLSCHVTVRVQYTTQYWVTHSDLFSHKFLSNTQYLLKYTN